MRQRPGEPIRKVHCLPIHVLHKSTLPAFLYQDIINQKLEIIVQIKGFDNTFGQTVHSRYSYLPEEIVLGGKFAPAYETSEKGGIIFHMEDLHSFKKVVLN